jgi:glycosyltransferase involved in cell wall biosynthesis
MKKILIVSTVGRHFYLFEQGNIEVLKSLGYEVHAAANFNDANERLNALDLVRHHFDIQRSPFSLKNIKAYKKLKEIMLSENFDVIHCHSPMGGVLARLAAKSVGITPVIYTAHGFHFYSGAPIANWLFYYPVEKILSKYTDILITINKEDNERAKKFDASNLVFIPGIGIDTDKLNGLEIDINKKRNGLDIPEGSVVLLSIGEMIKRKNHETALKAISKIKSQNYVYLICGKGELESYLKELVRKLGIEKNVKFLGFRNDIQEICLASDIFIFPSFQEGLPVSVMEAMTAELPVICSEIRGNTDLISFGNGGYLHKPNDVEAFANSIDELINDVDLRKSMGKKNLEIVKLYDKEIVKREMRDLYKSI